MLLHDSLFQQMTGWINKFKFSAVPMQYKLNGLHTS